MSESALDYLGSILVEKVRDASVSDLDMILSGTMRGDDAERIRSACSALDPSALQGLRAAVPALVDQVLHNLLATIDEVPDLDLVVTHGGQATNASEVSDGLAGELYGSRGWLSRFSRLRSADSR
jgi:hypothetical protein